MKTLIEKESVQIGLIVAGLILLAVSIVVFAYNQVGLNDMM